MRAERMDGRITARVAPETLRGDDLLEEIAIVQRSGSLTQTAYALLSVLLGIARRR